VTDIDTVIDALLKLNMFDSSIKLLYEELDVIILNSRLKPGVGGSVKSLHIDDDEIKASEQLTDLTMTKLFADMQSLVGFLHTRLPSSVSKSLSELLIPRLISLLISHWLSVNLPTDVKAIQDFKGVLTLTIEFAETLESYRWCGKDRLVEWANSIPQLWLNKRRGVSLDKVRRLMAQGLGQSEAVERVETQMLSRDDDAFAGTERNDDWNANWSDDGEVNGIEKVDLSSTLEHPAHGDDEDVNAWGFDDDTREDASKDNPTVSDPGNDEAAAWGWKEENEDAEAAGPEEGFQVDRDKSDMNGGPTERQVTLKETYNITAVPKQIFEIITHVVFDAEILKSPRYASRL
jgi:centromere/kinetochore protein ZW10